MTEVQFLRLQQEFLSSPLLQNKTNCVTLGIDTTRGAPAHTRPLQRGSLLKNGRPLRRRPYLLRRDTSAGRIFYPPLRRLPLLGEIACGVPQFAEGGEESMIEVRTSVAADFCLRATGDSMTGARIHDGDLVLVREQPTVENGEIAAVVIRDEATLKRVYYYPEKKRLILYPDNPSYTPLVFTGSEIDEVRILGKAVALQSLLN